MEDRSPETEVVGRNVRLLRRRLGMTQVDLAAAAALTQKSVSGIEAGGVVPRPSTLRRLADVLGVEVADLYAVGEEAPVLPLASAPAGEAGLLSRLSPEAKETARHLVGAWKPRETSEDLEHLRDELAEHLGASPERFVSFVVQTPKEDLVKALWPEPGTPEEEETRARALRESLEGLRRKLDEVLGGEQLSLLD